MPQEDHLTDPFWCCMVSQNLVSIGSGNGLLPDGTKPLPNPMTLLSMRFSGSHTEMIVAGKVPDINSNDIYLKLQPQFQGSHE